MKQSFTIIIFILLVTSTLKCQVSKIEIYNKWIESDIKVKEKINLDSIGYYFNLKSRFLIDSLTDLDIDTIGVFYASYVGVNTTDTCDNDYSPNDSYVFWKLNNKIFVQKITDLCEVETLELNNSIFFDYFIIYKEYLRKERVVPVITGAKTDDQNNIKYIDVLFIDHTTHYKIYCKIGDDLIFTYFEEYYFMEEKNLFHDHNINLKTYSWKKYIVTELSDLEFELND